MRDVSFENNMALKKELLEALKNQRDYASFYEWPDKNIKELGVVKNLVESLENSTNNPIIAIRPSEKDPPDITIKFCNQQIIGVEVTELVDEEAVRRNAQGSQVYRDWNPNEVIKKIQEILLKKDRKNFHGGPYARLFLAIHTDEPVIDPQNYSRLLKDHKFSALQQITEGFLIFSHDPRTKNYPVIQLSIT